MDFKKLNEKLTYILVESLENTIKTEVKSFIDNNGFYDFFTDYNLEDIEDKLAEKYGYTTYTDTDAALVLNVKNRPHINLDVTPEMQEIIDINIQDLANTLNDQYDNFVILGRMGGYWGLSNFRNHIIICQQGIEFLQKEVLTLTKKLIDQGEYTEEEIEEYIYDIIVEYDDDLFDKLLTNVDNFDIDDEYKEAMNIISQDIDEVEKILNDKETYNS